MQTLLFFDGDIDHRFRGAPPESENLKRRRGVVKKGKAKKAGKKGRVKVPGFK